MPYALLLALAASLGIHLAVLFGAEFDFSPTAKTKAGALPLLAELKPPARPPGLVAPPPPKMEPAKPAAKSRPVPRPKLAPIPRAKPVLSVPTVSPAASPVVTEPFASAPGPESVAQAVSASEPTVEPVIPAAASRLPANGAIDYRVDRGDSNFAIGVARHQWEIDGDHYRLTSMVQSTGIVWLFKDFRVEMESRGTITAEGLRPDFFVLRRNDKPTREKAFFDWERRKVRVGDGADEYLDEGAQDLLSFNYQLGFLADLGDGTVLPLATGRKYALYPLEVLGDEEIETPAGRLRTKHVRASGENTTELWLAYDYQLLPVKIRFVDSKGDSLVQVATHIETSPP